MNFFPIQIPIWVPTIAPSILQPHEVHLWRADLDQPDEVLSLVANSLSSDERERVERLRFEHHRKQAIVSRGILRWILSHYLQISPDAIQFSYSSKGKPGLLQNMNPQALTFNVTHSKNLALYAIAIDTLIGIDVEFQKPVPSLPQLIERFFLPKEKAVIAALPIEHQATCFYCYWTAKEALTKATGQGLSDLSQVELHVSSQAVDATYHGWIGDNKWQMVCMQPQIRYAATVVYTAPQPLSHFFFDWRLQ